MWSTVPRSNEVAGSDPIGHGSGGRNNLACRQAQRAGERRGPLQGSVRTSGTDPTTPGDTYRVTDPVGRPGEGFTFEVKPSTETLIIDPDTGRLLATVGIDERDRTSWSAYVRRDGADEHRDPVDLAVRRRAS